MQLHTKIVLSAVVFVVVVGPLLLALLGRAQRAPSAMPLPAPWPWKLTFLSALLYTLAFNLTFFIQELFLVLPKALTPGLRPTLFHNNHSWEGQHPLASLFQGTGALATLLVGLACLLLVRRGASRPVRLPLIWMAYCGIFMALPQVVIGALSAGSDMGMAMDYFELKPPAKTIAALIALGAIPPLARLLVSPLLGLADHRSRIATARERSRFMFQVATLPAFAAIALIVPFRVPREPIEVVLLPLIVTVVGIAWIQAGAWRSPEVEANGAEPRVSIGHALGAVLLLFTIFQGLLRPGIAFY
jgi:hypothetical protein